MKKLMRAEQTHVHSEPEPRGEDKLACFISRARHMVWLVRGEVSHQVYIYVK